MTREVGGRGKRKKRRRGSTFMLFPPAWREPVTITLTLHQDGGAMYAMIQNLQPVMMRIDVDPKARGFTEAVRRMVMQHMNKDSVTVGI